MIKIYEYGEVLDNEIFARPDLKTNIEDVVTDIIKNVREKGDSALYEMAKRFDGATLDAIEVTEKRKYWQLEGTAVKGIFERTWSKIKAENRRK